MTFLQPALESVVNFGGWCLSLNNPDVGVLLLATALVGGHDGRKKRQLV